MAYTVETIGLKRCICTLLLFIGTTHANEPLVPTVGFPNNAVKPCLTNHGKSIAYLSGNVFAPTISVVDTQWEHFVAKYEPVLDIGDELQCGIDSVLILGKDFTRKISTENGNQIDVKHNDISMKYLHDRVVVGNTLFESDDSTIKVTSLNSFEQGRKIQWPSGQFYDMRQYSESMLYKRQMDSGNNTYFLVDVQSGESREITSQIGRCTYASLTHNGDYLHAECSNKENRVFNTKTLDRVSTLEQYLFSIRKDRDQSLSLRFFDQYQNLILLGTEDKFIAWDMQTQKPQYVIEMPYGFPAYNHQDGTVLISGIDQEPYALLDVKSGHIRYQPMAYNKPLGIFIENGMPKTVLTKYSGETGIWNLFEHKWEQKLKEDPYFKDSKKAFMTDKYIFYTHDFEVGKDPVRQYNRSNNQLVHTYKTDSHNNTPKAIFADDKHQRVIIHYYGSDGEFGFKIFNTENGKLLYDLKSPHRNPRVKSMKLSDDGEKLIVQTAKSKGNVTSEVSESYEFDNEASIFTWELNTQKVSVEACGKSCQSSPSSSHSLSAQGNGFSVAWDEKRKVIVLTKDNNPYRQVYMYVPYGTSDWIDMDNFGYYDASQGGEAFVYTCNDGKCGRIDDAGKKYFKRPKLLEMFLTKENQ